MGPSLDRLENARAVLITGPTASGKSALALELAERAEQAGRPAVVVNADSMQVYDGLRILTARPTPAEEHRIPHRLYGHVPAAVRYSAGAWLRDVAPVLSEAASEGALPVIVGGTGLYFSALTKGLSAVPGIPPEIRAGWMQRLDAQGSAALHEELRSADPLAAAEIRPSDPQRIVRALEVHDATGRSLLHWRDMPADPPLLSADRLVRVVVEPPRATLYARIEARFDQMVEAGALDEVRALLARTLAPDMPAMKAIGVRPLAAYVRGELSLEQAVAASKLDTRRYAKRQMTWFRNQMADWRRLAL